MVNDMLKKLLLFLAFLIPVTLWANSPNPPAITIDTTYPNVSGYTVTAVAGGANLQTAITNASCNPNGTVLQLAAGATWTGNYTLPAKTCAANQWIIIRSNISDALLPIQGVRMTNVMAASLSLPQIFSNNSSPVFQTASNANYYWFMGVEMGEAPTNTTNIQVGLFRIGNQETTVGTLPTNIVLDRVYVHGIPGATTGGPGGGNTGNVSRCVEGNGTYVAVVDSYLSDCHYVGADAQAFAAWNSPGPFKLDDDYLEGAAENTMFGGANQQIVGGTIPSDITITHNSFNKPLKWRTTDPSYAGIPWLIKNLLEFKNAQRVLVQGNILQHNWGCSFCQEGQALLCTPRSQAGTEPQDLVSDVEYRYNIVQNVAGGWNISGEDNGGASGTSQHVYIHDNLLMDISGPNWDGGDEDCIDLNNGENGSGLTPPTDITYDHNTCFQTRHAALFAGDRTAGYLFPQIVLTNNIWSGVTGGIIGSGTACGNPTLTAYTTSPTVTANVFEGTASGCGSSHYPVGNYFPSTWAAVDFTNYQNGLPNGNYQLLPASPYHLAGLDGADIGANISLVMYYTNPPSGTDPGHKLNGITKINGVTLMQ